MNKPDAFQVIPPEVAARILLAVLFVAVVFFWPYL